MSPESSELLDRVQAATVDFAKLCHMVDEQLQVMRQLCEDLRKNRSAAAKAYISGRSQAEQNGPDS